MDGKKHSLKKLILQHFVFEKSQASELAFHVLIITLLIVLILSFLLDIKLKNIKIKKKKKLTGSRVFLQQEAPFSDNLSQNLVGLYYSIPTIQTQKISF